MPDAIKVLLIVFALGLLQLFVLAVGDYGRKLFQEMKETV